MDNMAHKILNNEIFENINQIPEKYGVNYYMEAYNNNTKLDDAEADFIFSEWYFERFSYTHPADPNYPKKSNFTIHHMMFIIIFYYVKYISKFIICI